MNISDPTISNLRSAASTDDPKKLYNVLVELPRSDRYRCLYSLDSQGMNLLEWVRFFRFENRLTDPTNH